MSKGVNKVILVGNLGQEPEVKQVGSNFTVATLSIATSESWKDKASGEKQEKTEWHRVVLFNKLGEIAGQYLRKGSKVYIEGKLETKKWTDKQGVDRYTTQIVGSEMQMLDGKGGDSRAAQQPGGYNMAHEQALAHGVDVRNDPFSDDGIPF